jgi:heme-degrading monooxygenase HmoA
MRARSTGRSLSVEVDIMYARVTTYLGAPSRFDDDVAYGRDNILPDLERIDGFRRVLILNDRASGRSVAVTFWESEDQLSTSEAEATRMRHDNPANIDSTVLSVERYEVALDIGMG